MINQSKNATDSRVSWNISNDKDEVEMASSVCEGPPLSQS